MDKLDEQELEWDDPYMPSYQGHPFTGIAVERDAAGVIRSEQCYVHGLLEGYFKRYDWDGNPLQEGYYHRNQKHGLWFSYTNTHKEGSLWHLGDRIPMEWTAPSFVFPSDEDDESFTGILRKHYPNGDLWYEVEMKNGIRQGTFRCYAPNKKILASGYYKDHQKDFVWEYYSDEWKGFLQYENGFLIHGEFYNRTGAYRMASNFDEFPCYTETTIKRDFEEDISEEISLKYGIIHKQWIRKKKDDVVDVVYQYEPEKPFQQPKWMDATINMQFSVVCQLPTDQTADFLAHLTDGGDIPSRQIIPYADGWLWWSPDTKGNRIVVLPQKISNYLADHATYYAYLDWNKMI